MKKPQSISLLGNALFTGAQEASSKRRSDDKKDARKKKLLKYVFRGAESLGNKILNQKNEKFLQNENFYVRDALVSTNIEENKKRLDDWNNRLNYEGGEDNYFLDRATAKIQKMPMYANSAVGANASEYSAHMHTFASELAGIMKANSKSNYEEATSIANKWSENPQEAFKTEVMKNRASNVEDFFTIPMVNFFAGNDERNNDKVAIDSVDSKTGLASQGKVDSKVFKTIYEKTGNYKTALSNAKDLKDFKDRFGSEADKLTRALPIVGETYTLNDVDDYGQKRETTVYDLLSATGQKIQTIDSSTGKNILGGGEESKANLNAQAVPETIIARVRDNFEEMLTPEDKKIFLNFKSKAMNTSDPSDKELKKFEQGQYGKVWITEQSLNDGFSEIDGWSPTFNKRLASQMSIENIKLMSSNNYLMSDTFDRSKSLLGNSDQYHPFVALKALLTLEADQNLPNQIPVQSLKKYIADNTDVNQALSNLTVGQTVIADKLFKTPEFLKLFPTAIEEPTEKPLTTQVQSALAKTEKIEGVPNNIPPSAVVNEIPYGFKEAVGDSLQWAKNNPVDAVAAGMLFIPFVGWAGSLGFRAAALTLKAANIAYKGAKSADYGKKLNQAITAAKATVTRPPKLPSRDVRGRITAQGEAGGRRYSAGRTATTGASLLALSKLTDTEEGVK